MSTPDPGLAPLVGSWYLMSVKRTFTDNGERSDGFGPNPAGRMVLAASGRIMFLIMRGDREQPTNDAERAILFNNMISYSGRVRSEGPGRFITTVDLSFVPSEVGAEYLRHFVVERDHLVIRLPEGTERFSQARKTVWELTWKREQ